MSEANKSRKEVYAEYLLTPHWAQLKADTFKAHGHACHACGSIECIDAHHLFYRNPLTDCTPDDMLPLCRNCHEKLHTIKHIIPSTMQRKNRKDMVDFVLSSLWFKFRIGTEPKKKPSKRKRRRMKRKEIEWRNRVLANPGRPLSVPTKKWISYQDTRIANEIIPIWELPVRNRSAGPIVKRCKSGR